MGLRFFIGGSGSGKSFRMYHEIIEESMKSPDRNFLILVPEQFTMQTQKDLCLMHPRGGIMNIDVLSFGRLSWRILEETGKMEMPVLDDTGKNLVLRKVAQEKAGELNIMRSHLKKTGYLHEVKSALSEFMQYGIGVADVDKLIAFSEGKGVLPYKLKDLKVLYEGFQDYNRNRFVTTEETLGLLAEALMDSEMIRKSCVYFDGFTGFTPVQKAVISQLMSLAQEVSVTVTMDPGQDPYRIAEEQNLFYLSTKTIAGLERLAEETGCRRDRDQDVILHGIPVKRYENNPELSFLEQSLFRYGREACREECERILLTEAGTQEDEVRNVCIQIAALIREKGCRYQDIAVVTGDLPGFTHLVEKQFPLYGIPYFLDSSKGILLNPFIEYCKSAFEIVLQNYSYETMFHFLRSGMTGLIPEEIDRLENYVLALGIRGRRRWRELWTRKSADMGEEFTQELGAINASRERIMSLLEHFPHKEDGVQALTEALYRFFVASGLQEQLKAREKQFAGENDLVRAKEYAQIYRLVIDLLSQMAELLPDERLSVREYAEIFYAGLEEIQVGILPQSVDQVVVGDIERTRLKSVKALFFIGINDGIIPKSTGTGGLLSDMEREFLKDSDYELAPTPRQQMYVQRLYLYLNMTKPSEYLYLSYARQNGEGTSLRPAYLTGVVTALFPGLVRKRTQDMTLADCMATREDGKQYLVPLLREYAEGNLRDEKSLFALYSWYAGRPEYEVFLKRLLHAVFYHYEASPLQKAVAEALYGRQLENSVSRLEQYAACAYGHFLKYGLKLTEREEFSFERVDMGNVFHGVLERFSDKLVQSGETWFSFPEEKAEQFVSEAMDAYAAEYGETVLYSSARNEYLITRMKRILLRTVKTLQYQLQKGIFQPGQFEVSFSVLQDLESVNVSLSQEESMRLRGRIDRVDIYENEEKVYVKIIDYKSGNHSFHLAALYYGLQLQLVVYLNAAMDMERKKHRDKEVVPAAVLYYHMEDPCITEEGGELSEEELKRSILNQLRMKGIVNADPEVVSKLDTTGDAKSDVIPVERKKDGSFTAASTVMEGGELKTVSDYVNQKIKSIGREILSGRIEVNPYEMGSSNACEYCAYRSVCGFDKRIPGYVMRSLPEEDKNVLLAKMQEEIPHEQE